MFASYVIPVSQVRGTGAPLVTAPNLLNQLTGPEYQLQLTEGIYVLRDEIQLGPIPPHPSEPVVANPNILDTKPPAPSGPVRVTLASWTPRKSPAQLKRVTSPNGSSVPHTIKENEGATDTGGGGGGFSKSLGKFGGFQFKDVKGGGGQKKHIEPKNAINKSSSSFISRYVGHDQLAKRFEQHEPSGLFAFVNVSRSFQWFDLSSSIKQEQMVKILFTRAHALCHHFNTHTASKDNMDMCVGYSSGDVLWYETAVGRYTRLNKNGMVNPTPVSEIRWLPSSDDLFVAAHFDGTLVVYDRGREDAPFVAEEETSAQREPDQRHRFQIKKSLRSTNQKNNPVAVWKVSNQRVNGLEFSPDGRFLAIVGEDGTLKILEHAKERLIDMYSSYYGGITCVCWSPDGRYLVTGGQDDLLSIWAFEERRLVSRCIGHRSWVASVAFDAWRCDHKSYRFGSVGQDARLLLWDFSPGMLHRPRVASLRQASIAPAGTRSRKPSQQTIAAADESKEAAVSVAALAAAEATPDEDEVRHGVEARGNVAMMPPVLSKEIDAHGLSWIAFEQDCIMTACKEGHIRTWDRPTEDLSGGGGGGGARSASVRDSSGGFNDPFR